MYGHHDYSLNLEIVQTKRDKEVRTKYHTSCTLGGYHTLANVVDFAQKTKTIYSKAVQALQKGYYVNLSLSYSVYAPTREDEDVLGKQLSFRFWEFRGYCHNLGYEVGDKIEGITLALDKRYTAGDETIYLTKNTFEDIAQLADY